MKKTLSILVLSLICLVGCSTQSAQYKKADNEYSRNMKRDILCVMMGYKGHIVDLEKDKNGFVYLVTNKGKKVLYDDKKQKSFLEKQYSADVQDMMEQLYPIKTTKKIMPFNFDPGRIRCYSFLNSVYGSNQQEIEKGLVNVKLESIGVMFNSNYNASYHLKEAIKESLIKSSKNPNVYSNIYPLSGTYNYRHIAQTNLLSPHAYAIAIDLAKDDRDYWKWTNEESASKRLESYPDEIIESFEKNYFVWGGKWNHFDILHFEYRPEIILKAKHFGEKNNSKQWFYPVKKENEVKNYINLIEKKL